NSNTSTSRDHSFREPPRVPRSHRTAGWRMAAVMRAATKGAISDSRGSPTFHSSHSPTISSTSRTPMRNHSLPRAGQVSFCSFISCHSLFPRPNGHNGPAPELPERGRRLKLLLPVHHTDEVGTGIDGDDAADGIDQIGRSTELLLTGLNQGIGHGGVVRL